MKTIKYLAMFFAASLLSATFIACGDDDDEPTNNPTQTEQPGGGEQGGQDEQPTVLQPGMLKIGDQIGWIKSGGLGFYDSHHIEIMLSSDDFSGEENGGPRSFVMMDLMNTDPTANRKLPTGTFKPDTEATREDFENDVIIYTIFNGAINIPSEGVGGLEFRLAEGSSPIKIEHNGGDNYTLTIEKLVVVTMDNAGNELDKYTTSFQFKGELKFDASFDWEGWEAENQ